jgi:hypothetical protein
VDIGGPGDAVSAGWATDVPSDGDAGGDEDGGCVCVVGEEGLVKGSDGSSGGEGDRRERDRDSEC